MSTGYRVGLPNFSKGVLSEELWSRPDVDAYNAGIRIGTNVVILKYGGLTKRPGTRLVYEITDGSNKLIPFEGAYNASYALLMGQAVMRPAAGGGMVLENQMTVEAATNTNPIQITASYHGLATGDEVAFNGMSGMTELNGRILPVTVTGTDSFTVAVDGTGFGTFTGDTGGTISGGPPPAPPPAPPVPAPAPEPQAPIVVGGGYVTTGERYHLQDWEQIP